MPSSVICWGAFKKADTRKPTLLSRICIKKDRNNAFPCSPPFQGFTISLSPS
jgi:hypothetical protein